MSAFNLQWSVDRSASEVVSLLTECMQVATQDGVQPRAIIASEKLGATLAMSSDSRTKVESAIDMQSDWVMIKFLKCKIGYAKNGTLDLLRRFMAGVNFLALVAALLGSMDNFTTAQALEIMMERTLPQENGDVTLPTAYQLDRLVEVLEPKLVRIKFMENVLHWKNWFGRAGTPLDRCLQNGHWRYGAEIPKPEVIHYIVDALRRVSRIGDADRVEIESLRCAPWIAAFVAWSLGVCPRILTRNGSVILDGPCPVTLIIPSDEIACRDVSVNTFRTQNSFVEIFTPNALETAPRYNAIGMVTMAVHSHETLQQLGFDRGTMETESLGYRAMKEALPKALYQVRSLCWKTNVSPENAWNPFPDIIRIGKVAKKYLDIEETFQLQAPTPGSCIVDLPLVRSWTSENENRVEPVYPSARYLEKLPFLSRLAFLVTNILALSLFDGCLDDIMLWGDFTKQQKLSNKSNLFRLIHEILQTGQRKRCSVEAVLDWALDLVGHNMGSELHSKQWLGSSYKSQVVFPKIFEHQPVPEEGWLMLYCIPGISVSNDKRNKVYRLVSPPKDTCMYASPPKANIDNMPRTGLENFFAQESIVWSVEDQVSCVKVAIGWSGGAARLNAFYTFEALNRLLPVKECRHVPSRRSPHEEQDALFVGPVINKQLLSDSFHDKIGVISIAGNFQLQLLALAVLGWHYSHDTRDPLALINQGACLACALAECRKLNCRYLIL